MANGGKIWVFFDEETDFSEDSFKALYEMAYDQKRKSGHELVYIGVGNLTRDVVNQLEAFSIDKIIVNPTPENISNMSIANILAKISEKEEPKLIIFPSSDKNKEVSSRLSIILNAGLTAECLGIEYDNEKFIFSRTANGDSLTAHIIGQNSKIQICTLKKIMKSDISLNMNAQFVTTLYYGFKSDAIEKRQIIQQVDKKKEGKIDYKGSKIVIGIGRGVSSIEDIEAIKRIASLINAEYGCTKSLSDILIMEEDRKIGQSGQIIAPDLYIAIGISGATQHLVGIKDSGQIIAVNKDCKAEIFKYADIGIVGDTHEFILEFEKKISSKF